MTQEEFFSAKKSLEDKLNDLMRQQNDVRDELNKLRDDYCHQLCEENQQYKDKKIKVVFEHVSKTRIGQQTKHKECIGFLTGFFFGCNYADDLYPTIAKVKKDGTPSKVEFSTWEMLPWHDVKSIEIIK